MGEPSFNGYYHSSRGWYIGSKDGEIETIGEKNDAPVIDPMLSASEIALLKGVLRQLQGAGTGNLPTTITGSIETVNTAPIVGVKTIVATAAEIFAGAAMKANRRRMIIKNEDSIMRFRIGPSSVTQQNGFPVEPGAVIEFPFDPAVAVPIYAISEGANLKVAVMEI